MNKQRKIALFAGGALAIGVLGTGTFAGLSSQQNLDANTFAGATVELGLTNNYGGAPTAFDVENLVPVPNAGTQVSGANGQGRQIKYFVLSNNGSINSNLSLQIEGIDAGETPFAGQLFVGNFYHDALGNPPPANNCSFSGAQYRLVNAADATEEWGKTDYVPLTDVIDKTWIFESANPMAPGDEECFVMTVYWQDDSNPVAQPFTNNDVMGSTLDFDLNFDLVQAAP